GMRTVYDRIGRPERTDRLQTIVMSIATSGGVATATYTSASVVPNSTTQTSYDDNGRVWRVIDARGNSTIYGYDEANRRVQVIRNNDAGLDEYTYSDYDENGNLTKTYMNSWDGTQWVYGSEVNYQYDTLNRRTHMIYPSIPGLGVTQQITGYDALGRRTQETDQANVVTRYDYDALGRLTTVTSAYNTPDQTVTTYKYDEVGNMTQQIDAEQRTTRFDYDRLGRRVVRTLPGNQ